MDSMPTPSYVDLHKSGELTKRAAEAATHLESCDLCARYCYVNRLKPLQGAVRGYGPHHGEENSLRVNRGSGTIFFSWCHLRCQYCQKWEILWTNTIRAIGPAIIRNWTGELLPRNRTERYTQPTNIRYIDWI